MGGFNFRTDPSITARGIAPAFDPIQSLSRIANLRRLQQRGQINQQQLDDMERERARQQAIRGAVGAGGTRADMLRRLQEVAPLAGLKLGAEFAKSDIAAAKEKREVAKDARAAKKSQLENALMIYGLVGREAGPLKALEEKGADLETMQVAHADSLGRLADAGIDVSKLPQEYKFGMADQALQEAVSVSKQIDQALRADEAAERKAARERKVPGRDVPFPADVEAQKKRISAARRAEKPPDPKVKIRAQEAKDRAMTRAVENYSKKIEALENAWQSVEESPEEGGKRTWVSRTGGVISNEEYLEKRREVEDELISAQEQADLSYLEKIETAGFEPGLPVDYRAQARARQGKKETTREEDPLSLF
ncbi:hypothetical protein LCGC14_1990580 [marine sediment metagenome]|uniref:Uncharacterized protein n=1 Tax=marine sediment metagenome TaxID=412755 RepID=A0A0F9F621_9ZZZZ